MVLLIVIMAFITVVLLTYIIFTKIYTKEDIVNLRLEYIIKDNQNILDSDFEQPLFIRVFKPIMEGISKKVLKITPTELVLSIEKKIIKAGKPYNLSVKEWVNLQMFLVVGLPILTILANIILNFEIRTIIALCIMQFCIGLIFPNLILNKNMKVRKESIQKNLPDVLDLLTVSVEAGLGFDAALTKVVDKMPGAISDEFDSVLQEIKVGRPKRDALKDMATRLDVNDLTTFIGSIIQADQLGVSVGKVLRIQSEQMREKKRQRAKEKAMKAPVKMLIPMVLFIFPTIFAVLIGPILIKVMYTLMDK